MVDSNVFNEIVADRDLLQSVVETLKSDYVGLSSNYETLKSDYADLSSNYETLKSEHAGLSSNYETLKSDYETLCTKFVTFEKENQSLSSKTAELEKRLNMNSSNSSLPPSSDRFKSKNKEISPNRKARRALGRKPGKQSGDKGVNLAKVDNPDEVIIHREQNCPSCNRSLEKAKVISEEIRQVFEIPEPRVIVTEHRAQKVLCECGNKVASPFPSEARATTCYGKRLRANALYLLAAQHIPLERAAETLEDLFNVKCSTGFLDNLYSEAGKLLDPFCEEVKNQLKTQDVLHFDETQIRVGKSHKYLHVCSTKLLTMLFPHDRRGKLAVNDQGILPNFKGVAVHDRFAMYDTYKESTHCYCNAHLLRDLASVGETLAQEAWTNEMSTHLLLMNKEKQDLLAKSKKRMPSKRLSKLLKKYDEIVLAAQLANIEPIDHKRDSISKKSYNLVLTFRDHKEEITRFVSDFRVPFTNNQAEQDLRMAKLQDKISGGLRTFEGLERFAKVRSYISTARKQGVEVAEVLTALFDNRVWIPPPLTI